MRRLTFVLWLSVLPLVGAQGETPPPLPLRLPETGLDGDARILHALNRLAYGPRPGDVEGLRSLGLATWIEAQLAPAQAAEAGLSRPLGGLATLGMSPPDLFTAYPPAQLRRAVDRRWSARMGMDDDAAMDPDSDPDAGLPLGSGEKPSIRALSGPNRLVTELSHAKLVRAVHAEQQLLEVMTDFWFNHFNVFAGKATTRWWVGAYERDAIRPHALGRFRDLLEATARHPAMLLYLDNWLSTAPEALADGPTLRRYADAAIRDQGLPPGGLPTLLLRRRGMDTRALERQLARQAARNVTRGRGRRADRRATFEDPRRAGLNENYARELLELHTLGVEGGYAQRDIVEVARCFTGWTVLPLQAAQRFAFIEEFHDRGPKTVLGTKIHGGGMAEGRAVLDLLARHPSTARFVATKLARRFVRDDPPAALVESMARSFLDSDGDIAVVMRTMLGSPEFWDPRVVGAKVKTPLELLASMLRATGARVLPLETRAGRAEAPLSLVLRRLGQQLYAARPPTGYPDTAQEWLSAGAMLQRFKLGFGLAANRLPGAEIPPPVAPAPEADLVTELSRRLLGRLPAESTLEALRNSLNLPAEELTALGLPPRFAASGPLRAQIAVGWILATPEFQRR